MGEDRASDAQLLAAIAAGDQAAFAALYDRHRRHAFHLARRLLDDHGAAEEVVQEVFLSVWRRAATFDPTRGAARAWLLSSVRHAAIGRTRGRWGHERRAVSLDDQARLPASDDPGAQAEAAELAGAVRAGVAALPGPQREAVELHYFAGLTCAELAARTAAPPGTAKGRLRLARARLRASLARVAPARAKVPGGEQERAMSRPTIPTILVIDDDRAILALMRQALLGEGYGVETAATLDEARPLLAARRCHLVLADVLRATDRADPARWEDLAAIRDAAGGTPVAIFSAHPPAAFDGYAARGFAGVIVKPFDLDALLASVAALARPRTAAAPGCGRAVRPPLPSRPACRRRFDGRIGTPATARRARPTSSRRGDVPGWRRGGHP